MIGAIRAGSPSAVDLVEEMRDRALRLGPSSRDGHRLLDRWAAATGTSLRGAWLREINIALLPGHIDRGQAWFSADNDEAQPVVFVEARCERDEEVVDVVGFSTRDPEQFGSILGAASWLDPWSTHNPANYLEGSPLLLHRTPRDWLAADCQGSVLIDFARAAAELDLLPGPVLCPDLQYGRALARASRGYAPPSKIRVPADGR